MKRLVSAIVALSLMGTVAASAQPFRGGHETYDRDFHGDARVYRDTRGGDWRGHRDEGAGLIGLGIGLFALAAIASAHNNAPYQGHYNDGYNSRPYGNDGYYGR